MTDTDAPGGPSEAGSANAGAGGSRWSRRGFVSAGGIVAGCLLTNARLPAAPASAANPVGQDGLRAIARGLRFGAAIDAEDLRDPAMRALFRRHCSSLTPRNALKWTAIERRAGDINYGEAERLADFAGEIGAGLYGHTLIWYRVPGWVAAVADRDELRRVMRRHINGAVRRFAGRVYAWDVVNEVFDYDRPAWRPSVFHKLLGEDHVREAFDLAHQADPKAMLVINETHLEKAGANFDARRAMMLDLVGRLRAKSTPIHAVGLQAHFRPGFDRLDAPALTAFVRTLARMGVGVYVTEMDGSCRFEHRLKPGQGGGRPRLPDADIHGRVFADTVRAAAGGGMLRGVTTWGLREKYSAAEAAQGNGCRARVLLYDEQGAPRSTLDTLGRTLQALSRPAQR